MLKVELVPDLCAGTDLSIANAARRSFNVQHAEFRTKADGPRSPRGRSDEELLEDLATSKPNGHWLPFRHPQLSFACDAPLPVARQLGKHQTGLTWSEVSRRYKEDGITFHRLDGTWRADPDNRKQGTGALLPAEQQEQLAAIQARNVTNALRDFNEALEIGASLEQCRFLLPQAMDVVWTWTGSLLAFAHMWRMRVVDPHAQTETREFVRQMDALIQSRHPVAWPLLKQHYAGDAAHLLVQ